MSLSRHRRWKTFILTAAGCLRAQYPTIPADVARGFKDSGHRRVSILGEQLPPHRGPHNSVLRLYLGPRGRLGLPLGAAR
jgi:hypothetical protein